MINKFLLIGGGLTLAGAGTGAGVGIYYANQNSGQSKSIEKPGKPAGPQNSDDFKNDRSQQQLGSSGLTSGSPGPAGSKGEPVSPAGK